MNKFKPQSAESIPFNHQNFPQNSSGIEALGKIRGAAASMGHCFLKRVKEMKDGVPLEKVAGNM